MWQDGRMRVNAWVETACTGWEGVMPGEPVQLGLMGVVHSTDGPPCGYYVRGPEGTGRILISAELVVDSPGYFFSNC